MCVMKERAVCVGVVAIDASEAANWRLARHLRTKFYGELRRIGALRIPGRPLHHW